MKQAIHPEYSDAKIICACGHVLETRSTVREMHVNTCSSCHPFFTGKAKYIDTEGAWSASRNGTRGRANS